MGNSDNNLAGGIPCAMSTFIFKSCYYCLFVNDTAISIYEDLMGL